MKTNCGSSPEGFTGDNLIPKQAQEGLKKLGEKIGESEWEEIHEVWWRGKGNITGSFLDYLKHNYYPPKPKEK